MSNRKDRETEFKKNLIAEAAYRLFAESSFESVTVESIAREAQFGKGTIYQYFPSKEEILVYVICQGLDELNLEIEKQCLGEKNAQIALEQFIELQYQYYHSYNQLFLSLLRRKMDGAVPEETFAHIQVRHRGKLELLTQILDRCIAAGLVAGDRRELAWAIENTVKGFSLGALESPGSYPGRELDLQLLKKLLFQGLCPPVKGGE